MVGSSKNRNNFRSNLVWLIAELLVVFIGVYGAFIFDNYRTNKQDEYRKQQIYTALKEEFTFSSEGMKQVVPLLGGIVTEFKSEYEEGKMPKPRRFHFVIGIRTDIWEAVLQSGALELIDVKLVFQLSNYYSFIRFAAEECKNFDRLIQQYIIPNADKNIEEFYNIKTKKFNRKYLWYLESLDNMNNYMNRIQKMTDSLLVEINNCVED
ncbi:hypothetical protein KAX29_06425 [candidate division WOR-3 bacterium]|nr:hypothetical protein [candidate division WOR-3 bacterium]